jgi:hypothetical protein
MNIKIFMHLMPWEIDSASHVFAKIASVKRLLAPTDKIYIHTCLNLSTYIINWEKSKLPKDFFIDKYNYIHKTLYEFDCKTEIYEKNELYGHLDFQRELIEPHIDYYFSICPDISFHPHTIYYLIEGVKQIKNQYFLITPEIPQLWDSSWDMMVNKNFKHYNYTDWENRNIHEIMHVAQNISDDPYIEKIQQFKWAGWFDIYNKELYEKLIPCFPNWHGYGPWDFFSINICTILKNQFRIDVEEYILRNQIIFDKDIGIYQNKKTPCPYKKHIYLNEIPNQRHVFESNFNEYTKQWFEYAKLNKII